MTQRILEILDNVRYWDTCPEDYKKEIKTFLETQNQALRIHDVSGHSEQLVCESCKQKFKTIDKLNFHCQECQPCKPLKVN